MPKGLSIDEYANLLCDDLDPAFLAPAVDRAVGDAARSTADGSLEALCAAGLLPEDWWPEPPFEVEFSPSSGSGGWAALAERAAWVGVALELLRVADERLHFWHWLPERPLVSVTSGREAYSALATSSCLFSGRLLNEMYRACRDWLGPLPRGGTFADCMQARTLARAESTWIHLAEQNAWANEAFVPALSGAAHVRIADLPDPFLPALEVYRLGFGLDCGGRSRNRFRLLVPHDRGRPAERRA